MGADELGFVESELLLAETGRSPVSARKIQRVVQPVGRAAQGWQEREGVPGSTDAPIFHVSADGPGAENILARRCIHSSRRLGAFWKHRLDAHAHAFRSDSLHLAA